MANERKRHGDSVRISMVARRERVIPSNQITQQGRQVQGTRWSSNNTSRARKDMTSIMMQGEIAAQARASEFQRVILLHIRQARLRRELGELSCLMSLAHESVTQDQKPPWDAGLKGGSESFGFGHKFLLWGSVRNVPPKHGPLQKLGGV